MQPAAWQTPRHDGAHYSNFPITLTIIKHLSATNLVFRGFEVQCHRVNARVRRRHSTVLYCRRDETITAVARLETCLNAVSHWMAANCLKLNAEKTELFWARSRYSAGARLDGNGPTIQDVTETVSASDHVHVLRVTFSSEFSMEKHAAGVSSLRFYTLRQLRRVRRSLDTDVTKTLVHSFVTTIVNYCNSAVAGSPEYNAAARLVSGTRKYDRGLSSLLR